MPSRPRPTIFTENLDGTDRLYLDQVGLVSGLRYTWGNPGGCLRAAWQMDLPWEAAHRALRPGRIVGIGHHVWGGKLTAPQRGRPWEFQAAGFGALAQDYVADAPGDWNVYDAATVIDNAISRGLPWRQYATDTGWETVAANADALNGSISVADTLNRVTEKNIWSWLVGPDRRVVQVDSAITRPTHMLYATDAAGGRTLDDVITAYLVTYQDPSGAFGTTWARNSLVESVLGHVREDSLDLTDEAPMDESEAINRGELRLGVEAVRALWGDAFQVLPGHLVTFGGQPVDLSAVQPPVVPQLVLSDADRVSEVSFYAPSRFIVSEFTYDVDSGNAEVTP